MSEGIVHAGLWKEKKGKIWGGIWQESRVEKGKKERLKQGRQGMGKMCAAGEKKRKKMLGSTWAGKGKGKKC